MNSDITYTRGTTYVVTHNYTSQMSPAYLGANLIFTVKTVPNDTDETDLTNAIMTPKVVGMSGSTFPQRTNITINPGDVAVTEQPGKCYYSVKVIDTSGAEYIVSQGVFNLKAYPTNEITT